jgi:hypothetical protein
LDAGPPLGVDSPSGLLPSVVLPGKNSLGKFAEDSDVAKADGADVQDPALEPTVLFDDEGEGSTVWFYNRCLVACCAAGANYEPLEVATKFLRFIRSACYGHVCGPEFQLSAVKIEKLQMEMLKDPSLSLFSQADNLLISDICNRASRLLNSPDFDERTLQAIDHLKDFQESDASDLAAEDDVADDVAGEIFNSGGNHQSDESSYYPSDGDDADDADVDRKPEAKKKSPKKGGEDVGNLESFVPKKAGGGGK